MFSLTEFSSNRVVPVASCRSPVIAKFPLAIPIAHAINAFRVQDARAVCSRKESAMLRLIGSIVLGLTANVCWASNLPTLPMPGQAKELTPMERDHYVPDHTLGKPENVPMLPPSRGKSEEFAGLNLLKLDLDMIPKFTFPLGLAQLPSWTTR